MIKYLLYDALLRPGAWTQAVLNDRERTSSWLRALVWLLRVGEAGEGGLNIESGAKDLAVEEAGDRLKEEEAVGSVVFLSSAG